MKWYLPLAVLGLGLLTFSVGVGYGVAYAGIPYQDLTPAMEARYQFHFHVGSTITGCGLVIIMLGLLTVLAALSWSLLRQRKAASAAQVPPLND